MKIGLIDLDGKNENIALMKLSTYYKKQGATIYLNDVPINCDKVFISVLYSWNRSRAKKIASMYDEVDIGGPGWDKNKTLPKEVADCKPDYNLYTFEDIFPRIKGIMTNETRKRKAKEIVKAGIGFTSRGCVRDCGFCIVPAKEGQFRQTNEIKDLINPKSNLITLLDNNFTADPYMIEKCKEIKERDLVVDICQGIDIRLLTDKKAKALSEIKHHRSIHYAWDLIEHEDMIMRGIKILSKYIKRYKHMCFMLVGYNTTFEQDMYRFKKLTEKGIDPYVMPYNKNQENDRRIHHFKRWVNGRIYKKCTFENYKPWIKERKQKSLFAS